MIVLGLKRDINILLTLSDEGYSSEMDLIPS